MMLTTLLHAQSGCTLAKVAANLPIPQQQAAAPIALKLGRCKPGCNNQCVHEDLMRRMHGQSLQSLRLFTEDALAIRQ